jgi:hypothetical protein
MGKSSGKPINHQDFPNKANETSLNPIKAN